MTTSYLKNKEHIYNWREAHKDEWNKYMMKYTNERYHRIKEEYNKYRKELYHLRKNPYYAECERFRKILL